MMLAWKIQSRGRPRAEDRRVEDVQQHDQLGHGVHRDAAREDRHHREGDGVQPARLLVEPQPQVLGHRVGPRAVVERHHEQADEDHRRDRADPVEVAGGDPVLGPRGGHADDLLRPEVGRDERQPADPGGDRPAREEEVLAGLHELLERKADPQHEGEVDQHDQVVDPRQCGCHARFLSSAAGRVAGESNRSIVRGGSAIGCRDDWARIMTPIRPDLNTPEPSSRHCRSGAWQALRPKAFPAYLVENL